jgi:hypothetical protein
MKIMKLSEVLAEMERQAKLHGLGDSTTYFDWIYALAVHLVDVSNKSGAHGVEVVLPPDDSGFLRTKPDDVHTITLRHRPKRAEFTINVWEATYRKPDGTSTTRFGRNPEQAVLELGEYISR